MVTQAAKPHMPLKESSIPVPKWHPLGMACLFVYYVLFIKNPQVNFGDSVGIHFVTVNIY